MVLCDKLNKSKKLEEVFKVKGEAIASVYYDDIVDCINKINYYNENDDLFFQIMDLKFLN